MKRKLRILVVDDEELIRRILRRVLEADGHTVVEALNGDEAWNQFLAQAETRAFDLVITDVNMPIVSGIELLKRIKASTRITRIICLSGVNDLDSLLGLRAQGFTEVLGKPVDSLLLRETIVRLFDGQPS